MYLGTNVNINENLASHAYLFIPLYAQKTKKLQGKRDFHLDPISL
jgi:hypothetical protein